MSGSPSFDALAAQALDVSTVRPHPVEQFEVWFEQVRAAGVRYPDSMTVATVSADGQPSARTLLLRQVDSRGFVFFTNLDSPKARDLDDSPVCELVFHWREVSRQVRVAGATSRVEAAECDAYWSTRPRGHQISAWASPQSTVLADRDALDHLADGVERRFAGSDVPRPPFWGGFRVAPDVVELWQGRDDRRHDRVRYLRDGDVWVVERLAP